jgi:hypothetical protein
MADSHDKPAAQSERDRKRAEALRANLRRRKAQARDRADSGEAEPIEQPPSSSLSHLVSEGT